MRGARALFERDTAEVISGCLFTGQRYAKRTVKFFLFLFFLFLLLLCRRVHDLLPTGTSGRGESRGTAAMFYRFRERNRAGVTRRSYWFRKSELCLRRKMCCREHIPRRGHSPGTWNISQNIPLPIMPVWKYSSSKNKKNSAIYTNRYVVSKKTIFIIFFSVQNNRIFTRTTILG